VLPASLTQFYGFPSTPLGAVDVMTSPLPENSTDAGAPAAAAPQMTTDLPLEAAQSLPDSYSGSASAALRIQTRFQTLKNLWLPKSLEAMGALTYSDSEQY
jgi:hypothetical protein